MWCVYKASEFLFLCCTCGLQLYFYLLNSTETQWEKPDSLQLANSSEKTATSSEEQMTYQYTTTASSEGDTGTAAGVKRSSSDDNSTSNSGSEVKRPYDWRGYCRGGVYGSWTIVTVR